MKLVGLRYKTVGGGQRKSTLSQIHHLLLDLGLGDKKVLLILTILSIFLNYVGVLIFVIFGSFISILSFAIFLLLYIRFSVILSRKIKH